MTKHPKVSGTSGFGWAPAMCPAIDSQARGRGSVEFIVCSFLSLTVSVHILGNSCFCRNKYYQVLVVFVVRWLQASNHV